MVHYRLISFKLCPYVQRAAIVLAEKKVPFERVNIEPADKPAWFYDLSPLGKVPVLVIEKDGEETVLFESAVISEYLDEIIAPALHPADPLEKARHRAWIEFASSMLSDIHRLFTGDRDAFETGIRRLDEKFGRLEQQLGDGPWFAGKGFSLVDSAFAPVLRYFDTFDPLLDRDLFAGRPALQAWRKQLRSRPSVIGAVYPDYAEALVRHIRKRKGHMASLVPEAEREPA